MGVAGWMRYISGQDESGQPIDVRDPMADRFQAIYAEHGLSTAVVRPLLAIEAIFGSQLIANESFVKAVTDAYELLLDKGAREAVASL